MTDRNAIIAVLTVAIMGKTAPQAAAAVLDLLGPRELVWDVFEGGGGAKAKIFGHANYLITRWADGKFEVCESYPGYQGARIGDGFYPTIEAAQAAAQAHAYAAHWANTPMGDMIGGE